MTKEELLQALQNAYVVEQENKNLLNDLQKKIAEMEEE